MIPPEVPVLRGKNIADLTTEDIESLVGDRVSESLTLDFKRELPSGKDQDRTEFLYDVTAFANTAGGTIIYGVEEAKDDQGAAGYAERVVGLKDFNEDVTKRKLTGLLRDGCMPAVGGVEMRTVPTSAGPVFLVTVPRSWRGLHMVSLLGQQRFYGRGLVDKHPLTWVQIREGFLGEEGLLERLRRFRTQRVEAISSQVDLPVPLDPGATVALHVLPFDAFQPGGPSLPLVDAAASQLPALKYRNEAPLYNLDGVVPSSLKRTAYVQVFRDGAIEHVRVFELGEAGEAPLFLRSYVVEGAICEATQESVRALLRWGFAGPFIIGVTLLGAREFLLHPGGFDRNLRLSRKFGRDVVSLRDLQLPVEYVGRLGPTGDIASVAKVLRPTLDVLWQAAGFAECGHYRDGEWRDFG